MQLDDQISKHDTSGYGSFGIVDPMIILIDDFTYDDFPCDDFTYDDFTYNDFTYNDFTIVFYSLCCLLFQLLNRK
jgi:hypothetical protein